MNRELLLDKLQSLPRHYCLYEENPSGRWNYEIYTFANDQGIGKCELQSFNPLKYDFKISQHSLKKIAEYIKEYGKENLLNTDSLPYEDLEIIYENLTQDSEIGGSWEEETIEMAIVLFEHGVIPDTYYHFYKIDEDATVSDWEIYYEKEEVFDRLCRLCEVEIDKRWEEMETDELEKYYNELKELKIISTDC